MGRTNPAVGVTPEVKERLERIIRLHQKYEIDGQSERQVVSELLEDWLNEQEHLLAPLFEFEAQIEPQLRELLRQLDERQES